MILVLVETNADGVTLFSREALTFARGLAQGRGDTVEAVVVGEINDDARAHLGEQGIAIAHHPTTSDSSPTPAPPGRRPSPTC